jgi:ribonuclease P protein component
MTHTLGKIEKLKSKKRIQQLFEEGSPVAVPSLKLLYLPVEDPAAGKFKVAFAVPKKNFKSAVDRNKIKRLLREAYRLNKEIIFNNIEGNYAFLILYLGNEIPAFADLKPLLVTLLNNFEKKVNNEKGAV